GTDVDDSAGDDLVGLAERCGRVLIGHGHAAPLRLGCSATRALKNVGAVSERAKPAHRFVDEQPTSRPPQRRTSKARPRRSGTTSEQQVKRSSTYGKSASRGSSCSSSGSDQRPSSTS